MSTLFSQIIAGAIPGRFVWADDRAVVLATIAPISPGHVLVVPRAEVADFTVADDALLGHLVRVAKIIGAAQKVAFTAPRAALLVAGFEVPHLHLHVLPAWGEAELSFANARPDTPAEELDAAAERLRTALRDAGEGARVPADLGRLD